jgi:translation initiation factor 2 gamma subunit (eIF-2gamma)
MAERRRMATASQGPSTGGRYLNINVAVMGHVDAGKTSLVRLLSQQLSTAALDKHPASRERGCTIDLGFSCTRLERRLTLPELGKNGTPSRFPDQFQGLLLTWIDCPGHASLLRTVLLGASVMDLMLLVIDATAGVQVQTLECLALGTIFARGIVVALHKCDRLPKEKFSLTERIHQVQATIRASQPSLGSLELIPTWIGPEARHPLRLSPTSALTPSTTDSGGISELLEAVRAEAERILSRQLWVQRQWLLQRPYSLLAVDHVFEVTGQGTVLTGILLTGRLRPGMQVQSTWTVPANEHQRTCLGQWPRPIRSLQIYREPVSEAIAGDRVAIGLASDHHRGRRAVQQRPNKPSNSAGSGGQHPSQRNPEDKWERGLVYAPPEAVSCYPVDCILVRIQQGVVEPGLVETEHARSPTKVFDGQGLFTGDIPSVSTQWQVTLALDTVPGRVTHWLRPPDPYGEHECVASIGDQTTLSIDAEERRSLLLVLHLKRPVFLPFESASLQRPNPKPIPLIPFRYALLSDAHWKASFVVHRSKKQESGEASEGEPSKTRLRFVTLVEAVLSTRARAPNETQPPIIQHFRVYRRKERIGSVERILDHGQTCIVRDLFQRDMQHLERMIGLRVQLEHRVENRMAANQRECVSDCGSVTDTRVGGQILRAFGQRGKVVVQLDRVPADWTLDSPWIVRLRFQRPVPLGIPGVDERASNRHAIYQRAEEGSVQH